MSIGDQDRGGAFSSQAAGRNTERMAVAGQVRTQKHLGPPVETRLPPTPQRLALDRMAGWPINREDTSACPQSFETRSAVRRYGNGSTVLTSNKGFEEWSRILGDEVVAAALLHRCHIVNIRANGYRMRRHAELSKAIHPLANRIGDESPASGESSLMTTALPARCPAPIAPLTTRGSRRTGTLSMPIDRIVRTCGGRACRTPLGTGSQPTHCHTTGLARGSAPSIPERHEVLRS